MRHIVLTLLAAAALPAAEPFAQAQANGRRFDECARSMNRLLEAWLKHACARTLLLPDRIPGLRGLKPGDPARLYTPHNSGADLYPYLILTAQLTNPALYRGRMMDMLRNEVRYTTALDSIPGNLEMTSGKLGEASIFGAAEYAKDGLLAVTEYLGRTPWFYRLVDMTADTMRHAPVKTRFGMLPASGAEVNGDMLQVLVRLAPMTGDARFLEWARRIGDAYVEEVLPGSHGLPSFEWNFEKRAGDPRIRIRDHGNEAIVGLTLLYALEQTYGTPRAERYRPAVARMLDRVLASANPDGMLYNVIDAESLKPLNDGLSDNWGYVYGSVYAFYQATGETKYRDAVRRVLRNLPDYRNYDWERDSFDGYADSIESALYLAAREPVPEALDWIESETRVMMAKQRPDGHFENWYGEGNYNRTLLLYMLMKSQGVRPDAWAPGVEIGAVRQGERLYVSLNRPGGWNGLVQFDYARHRRVMNFAKDWVRLNEFPEWYTVDENTLYRVRAAADGKEELRLGSELIAGIPLASGNWIVEPAGRAPYGNSAVAGQ